MRLTLHGNIQFIYEFVLSRKELDAFGAVYEAHKDLRSFEVQPGLDVERFARRCAYFKDVDGRLCDYHHIQRHNQTGSVNQYLTHWIYPYKGKFHPQMIRALCNIIGLGEGDLLLDPFVGSGTAALEAQLLGINFVGVDVSPLCVLQARVKTQSLGSLERIVAARQRVRASERATYSDIEPPEARDFYRLAQMIAHSDSRRRRKDFAQSFGANADKMIASVQDYAEVVNSLALSLGEVTIRQGDARRLDLADSSVEGIITSPPYSIALNYVQNDAHALEAMGHRLEEIQDDFIGVRGRGRKRFQLYREDMALCYREMFRVLKPGGRCVVVIGNVTYQGEEVATSRWTKESCAEAGFELEDELNKIIFGLYNVMREEFVQIYRKPACAP